MGTEIKTAEDYLKLIVEVFDKDTYLYINENGEQREFNFDTKNYHCYDNDTEILSLLDLLMDNDWRFYPNKFKLEKNNYFLTIEDKEGGEDEGDTHLILSLSNNSNIVYIKIEGYFDSWEGFRWIEPYLVEPYEKTIIDYRKIE